MIVEPIKHEAFAVVTSGIGTVGENLRLSEWVSAPHYTHGNKLGLEERVVDVARGKEDDDKRNENILVHILKRIGKVARDEFEKLGNALDDIFWQHPESERCFGRQR